VQPARNFVTPETEQGIQEVTQFLSEHSKLPLLGLRQHLFILLHQDAIMHLMRVAAGLDSLVLGEGQILAQVKQVHKLGQQYNGIKLVLNRLFKQAITAGKRVRTETSIGTGAVSISSAAVELAQMKGQNLAARVAIIGAGKMSRLLVQHLLAKGAVQISILNRSRQRAENWRVSSRIQLQLYAISEMMAVMAKSDLVFTSTAATEPLIERSSGSLEPNRPLMLVDISVPRVHGNVQDIAHVQAFNVDDLKAVVAQNYESRKMAMEAEGLLKKKWKRLMSGGDHETVSTISCLRNKVETIREQELEKLCLPGF